MTCSSITVDEVPFDGAVAAGLIAEVQQEYVARYGGPDETPVDPAEFQAPYGVFVVASAAGEVVGCAGLRRHSDDDVEVKRMYVRASHRRHGHGSELMTALEDRARAQGFSRVILETGLAQPEAIALYEGAGYARIPSFGHYRTSPQNRCFAKTL